MMREEMLDRAGEVVAGTPTNLFRFA
jgi:hypothetical protein